jgi:hypothetical protein
MLGELLGDVAVEHDDLDLGRLDSGETEAAGQPQPFGCGRLVLPPGHVDREGAELATRKPDRDAGPADVEAGGHRHGPHVPEPVLEEVGTIRGHDVGEGVREIG